MESPYKLPDGIIPVTSGISIYDQSIDIKPGVDSLMSRAVTPPLPAGSLYMEELGEDLWFETGGHRIPFGASLQDVLTELGDPCEKHMKRDHWSTHFFAASQRPICGDYFYNYFGRGLDILFDGHTHKIKKFVLHTNYPGHADFNSYQKCNFVIHGSVVGQIQGGDGPEFHITPSTTWDQVQEFLGESGPCVIPMTNPNIVQDAEDAARFGGTYIYGYRNIAFEVMRNGYIATVTLFRTD